VTGVGGVESWLGPRGATDDGHAAGRRLTLVGQRKACTAKLLQAGAGCGEGTARMLDRAQRACVHCVGTRETGATRWARGGGGGVGRRTSSWRYTFTKRSQGTCSLTHTGHIAQNGLRTQPHMPDHSSCHRQVRCGASWRGRCLAGPRQRCRPRRWCSSTGRGAERGQQLGPVGQQPRVLRDHAPGPHAAGPGGHTLQVGVKAGANVGPLRGLGSGQLQGDWAGQSAHAHHKHNNTAWSQACGVAHSGTCKAPNTKKGSPPPLHCPLPCCPAAHLPTCPPAHVPTCPRAHPSTAPAR
jgi:hypothetical protein